MSQKLPTPAPDGIPAEVGIPPNINIGDKVLVTFDNFFFAPDGQQYRAAFGTVRAIRTAEDSLGVRPNGRSTNWYLEVGEMLIAGCQIHYLVKTDVCHLGRVTTTTNHEGQAVMSQFPSYIYKADKS